MCRNETIYRGVFNLKYRKYHNKKTIVDGIQFDSLKEGMRYSQLNLLCKVGVIKNLELQKEFELIPAQYEYIETNGKKKRKCIERACKYKADFVYEKDGETIVEDTKGYKTVEYVIKRKLMLYIHGIKIIEI